MSNQTPQNKKVSGTLEYSACVLEYICTYFYMQHGLEEAGSAPTEGGLGAVGQVVAEVARPTQPGTTVDVTVEGTTMGERTVRTGAQIWERGRPQTDLS